MAMRSHVRHLTRRTCARGTLGTGRTYVRPCHMLFCHRIHEAQWWECRAHDHAVTVRSAYHALPPCSPTPGPIVAPPGTANSPFLPRHAAVISRVGAGYLPYILYQLPCAGDQGLGGQPTANFDPSHAFTPHRLPHDRAVTEAHHHASMHAQWVVATLWSFQWSHRRGSRVRFKRGDRGHLNAEANTRAHDSERACELLPDVGEVLALLFLSSYSCPLPAAALGSVGHQPSIERVMVGGTGSVGRCGRCHRSPVQLRWRIKLQVSRAFAGTCWGPAESRNQRNSSSTEEPVDPTRAAQPGRPNQDASETAHRSMISLHNRFAAPPSEPFLSTTRQACRNVRV